MTELNGQSFQVKRVYKKLKTMVTDKDGNEKENVRNVLCTNKLRIDIPFANKVCFMKEEIF